ncbi:MAG: penicillin acylase family protein [bacterium]|nr:penicillin acylase family protein [bacterium]
MKAVCRRFLPAARHASSRLTSGGSPGRHGETSPMRRRLLRSVIIVSVCAAALLLAAVLAGGLALRGSLARLDGTRGVRGLAANVTIERDALGAPRVLAESPADAARALGWLHAQERCFQMDLLRRAAAGELSALLGPALLGTDRDVRRHRFGERLEASLLAMDEPSRSLLEAYAAGVNAGLDDLRVRPPEYLLLRQQPRPWRPLDSLLVVAAMYLDLGLYTAEVDLARGLAREVLPRPLAEFVVPMAGHWDAPLTDEGPALSVLPTAEVAASLGDHGVAGPGATRADRVPAHDRAGSNSWAVAGRLTRHGGALLANDMHLGHALPNIWYRAELRQGHGAAAPWAVGVTLPGVPGVIAGSNGRVAWGFTNAYGDWLDLVALETDPADSTRYRVPAGWDTLRTRLEVIEVAGRAPDTLVVRESRWGPVWARDASGRPLVLRWTAHDAGAVNLELLRMATVRSVDEALALAPGLGMPGQNLVCADADGRIAWTIAGRLPRRYGWDGRTPASWADGTRGWDGWLDPAQHPRLADPPEGRLWTANNRVAGGTQLDVLGDGGYALGARALQIRDGLRALKQPVESDLLALQLDDRALYQDYWRGVALASLERAAPAADPAVAARRERFARLAREGWDGRASVGSVGYRVVRAFSGALVDLACAPLLEPVRRAHPAFDGRDLPLRPSVARELVERRPAHLVPAPHRDWDALAAAAVDTAMARLEATGEPESAWTWGARNTAAIEHPFAAVLPWLRSRLAAPPDQLPGDSNLPRVQHPTSGASERLVVSPGREQDGLFHMPGGQSGHPLSPFFLAGHDDWVHGRPAPLLPQAARHRLVLTPAGR